MAEINPVRNPDDLLPAEKESPNAGRHFTSNGTKEAEDSLLDQQVAPPLKPGDGVKFKAIYVIIICLVIGGILGNRIYNDWKLKKALEQFGAAEKEMQSEAYTEAMADTYGGKTPYETLHLYIEAVKKGDYELASKYFIKKYQAQELDFFGGAVKDAISKYLANLEEVAKSIANGEGGYSEDKKEFTVTKPFLMNFILYPNSVWKITEL